LRRKVHLTLPGTLLAVLAVSGILVASRSSALSCPGADADALQWLDKMARSAQEVSYQGIVTFQRGGDMQVMQVSHSIGSDSSSERLTELTGQGAEVVRIDHPLECVHPGHKLLQIGADLQAGNCGIAQFYRFSMAPGERIAGRKAVRLLIEPGDMYRYGYVMELDRETGLILKASTMGPGNAVLEQFQFANLSYVANDAGSPEVSLIHQATHPHPGEPATAPSSTMPWQVGWLPRGFSVTDTPADSGRRRTYTDGLAVFSVFLEELSVEIRPGEGVVHNGGTTSYTRGMRIADQPVLVTVIGEVPVNTARMVADSITASSPSEQH
jgi:sigma-E factor negative regulatory protein RseB